MLVAADKEGLQFHFGKKHNAFVLIMIFAFEYYYKNHCKQRNSSLNEF